MKKSVDNSATMWQNKQAVAMTGTSIGCQKSLKNFKKSIDKVRKM